MKDVKLFMNFVTMLFCKFVKLSMPSKTMTSSFDATLGRSCPAVYTN